jgi:hypothetical protein
MHCRKLYLYIVLVFFILITGCRKKDKEWDINALIPIAHGDLSINNLVSDTILKKNADNSFTLVNVQKLSNLDISDLLKVPDTSFTKTVSLKQINLGTRILKRDITLGEVAKNAGLAGAIIAASNGKKMVVPAISNLSTGQTNIDAQSFFKTATFIDGTLELSIRNGFPIELTDMHFQLMNKGNGAVIIDDTIVSILPGQTHTKAYSLAGKTVDGNLVANILSMNSPGSKGDSVLIDTTNAISITIKGYNMHVFSATAIFPAQNVVDDKLDINYNLQGPVFKSFIIRSGTIEFNTNSTIQDNMYLHYAIPGAMKNGIPLSIDMVVPPSVGGATITKDYPLDGYSVDLTGKNHDTVNTFYNELQVHLDSTGKMESLSLADSVYIHYALKSVIPEYARGYLGKQNYSSGAGTADIDLFKNIKVDKLTLPQVKVHLQISNGVGATAEARIKSLIAWNTKTNKQITLSSAQYVDKPITIPPATDNPLKPALIDILLDNSNSNINDMISLLPDKLLYIVDYTIDPNGNSNNYNDFIYYESALTANLNIEIPLEAGFEGLVLADTLVPDFGTVDASRVQSSTLHLTTLNDYPLEAKIQVYIIDNNNNINDSLLKPPSNVVPAGNGDPISPIPGKGNLTIFVSQDQLQQIINHKRLILKSTLRTTNANVVKIYSTSHLKATLTGEFRYRTLIK